MTDNPTSIEPTEEVWIFGGSRVMDSKRCHAWIPLSTDVKHPLYFRPTGSQIPGSEYLVRVTRSANTISMHGRPTYHGRHGDDAVRAYLETCHRNAETRLRLLALERNDKRHSALDAAVEPLCDLIKSASMADREAFLAYVMRRLSRAW